MLIEGNTLPTYMGIGTRWRPVSERGWLNYE